MLLRLLVRNKKRETLQCQICKISISLLTLCDLFDRRGFCKNRIASLPCQVGARKRACYILCGSVLSVWSKVETILSCQPGASSKMQIIRAKLANGKKLVGKFLDLLVLAADCGRDLIAILSFYF